MTTAGKSGATGGGPQGFPMMSGLVQPLRPPLPYSPDQPLHPAQQPHAYGFQLIPSLVPTAAPTAAAALAPFLWQQPRGPPLPHPLRAGGAVRLSSRLPGPQGQQVRVQRLMSAAAAYENHLSHRMQPSTSLAFPGAATLSQSRGPLPSSVQAADPRALRLPSRGPAPVAVSTQQYLQGPQSDTGGGLPCHLLFNPRDGTQRIQQYIFHQQPPQQTTLLCAKQQPQQPQQQQPFAFQSQGPHEAHQHTQIQQPHAVLKRQAPNAVQRNYQAVFVGSQETEAARGCHLTKQQPAGGPPSIGGGSKEAPSVSPLPTSSSETYVAAEMQPSAAEDEAPEAGAPLRESADEPELTYSGRQGVKEKAHLWKAAEGDTEGGCCGPDAAAPGQGTSWCGKGRGGALLRPFEKPETATEQQTPRPLCKQGSKTAAMRSASSQPACFSSRRPPTSVEQVELEESTPREASEDSTVASCCREGSREEPPQASYVASCIPFVHAEVSDLGADEIADDAASEREDNFVEGGVEPPCMLGGVEDASYAAESADLEQLEEEVGGESEQQEGEEEEEERYVKVLVPKYKEWLLNRAYGEEQEAAQEAETLWASDLLIDTSPSGLGREVVVNTKQCRAERPLINTCVERLGWIRDDQTCNKGNIIWLGGSVPDHDYTNFMRNSQVVNRFPGMWDMTKKRMLSKILYFYQDLFPDLYDFSPPCWSFPEDRARIEKLLHPRNLDTYIIKPDGGAMGSGIQLVSRYRDIDCVILRGEGNYVMQKYIDKPRLLNRRKFDLRVYAAVYSVTGKLKVFLSRVGMARFCTDEYRPPTRRNQDNAFMHLTNYSINKENASCFIRSPDIHSTSNSKRLLKDVLEDLRAEGVNVDKVWQSIKNITVKTFVCLQPWLNLRYRHVYRGARQQETSRCFQFLGLDILLDEDDKCWLLEVNSNPSLRIDYFDSQYEGIDVQLESTMDRAIKEPAVSEALALASKLLLRPSKRKQKDSAEAPLLPAAASAEAAKRKGGSRAKPQQAGAAGASKAGSKAKGRGPAPKQESGASGCMQGSPSTMSSEAGTRPHSPPRTKCTQPAAGESSELAKETLFAAKLVCGCPRQATHQQPQDARGASLPPLAKRSREVGRPASSLVRRSASVAEGRKAPGEQRGLRRSLSSACLGGAKAAAAGRASPPACKAGAAPKLEVPSKHGSGASPQKEETKGRVTAAAAGAAAESRLACVASALLAVSPGETPVDGSDTEPGDGALSLRADSELIESAYKEIKKCMECFNVLGLRFQRSSLLPLKQPSTGGGRWPNAASGVHTPEDGESIKGRRGGGGPPSLARAHAPFRPFLRKDRNLAKKHTTPVKSTYTKLHKDILKPFPEEELQPQGCWVSLEREAAALVGETKLVKRVQLLFERITGFPKKIALERSRWLEVCEEVRFSDIFRKVQVAVASQTRSSRGSTPQPPFTSFRPAAPPRPLPPAVARRVGARASSLCRSASSASLVADTPERGASGAAGGGFGRQRSSNGGPLLSSGCTQRKRRLSLVDLETLFLQQMQQMRRQTQLQDSCRGLGLLEFAHMLKILAVLCYPFLPPKASLVAMALEGAPSNGEGVLDQVVEELEREQQLALSPQTASPSRGSSSGVHTPQTLGEQNVAAAAPPSGKKKQRQPSSCLDTPQPEGNEKQKVDQPSAQVDVPLQQQQQGRVEDEHGQAVGSSVCPAQSVTKNPEPTAAAAAAAAATGGDEGQRGGLAARPATADEETVTLLSRRVAEGTSQLGVLDTNQRHLEKHLQQLENLRQQLLSKQASLVRLRRVNDPHALLQIANMEDIFGGSGWRRQQQQQGVNPVAHAAALRALDRELLACDASIRSANYELQKTKQVRAAVASLHQQQQMQLQQLRQQQRQLEEEQLQQQRLQQQLEQQQQAHAAAAAAEAQRVPQDAAAPTSCCAQGSSSEGEGFPAEMQEGETNLSMRSNNSSNGSKTSSSTIQSIALGDLEENRLVRRRAPSVPRPAAAGADRREGVGGAPHQQVAEGPEWHETLCAAWPDVNSQVLGVVPKAELKEAFQLLIDFFELRMDLHQCSTHWAAAAALP
ncbi:hypothetical protein Esti_006447 [Eimeria stiedai]